MEEHTTLSDSNPDGAGWALTFDESEHIETLLLEKRTLLQTVESMAADGIRIDSKILAYAIAGAGI